MNQLRNLVFVSVVFLAFPLRTVAAEPSPPAGEGKTFIPRQVDVDTNKDGQPDRHEYYKDGKLEKIETDTNFDGKVDEWTYAKDGDVVKVEKDSDYDGKVDKWITY